MERDDIFKYVAREILDRLIISRDEYYHKHISEWKHILNYNNLVECVVKNKFTDLFKILYDNGLISRDDIMNNLDGIYEMDKDMFVDIVSEDTMLIYNKSKENLMYDVMMKIYDRIKNDNDKIKELFRGLMHYVNINDIYKFVTFLLTNNYDAIKADTLQLRFMMCDKNRRSFYIALAIINNTDDVSHSFYLTDYKSGNLYSGFIYFYITYIMCLELLKQRANS